MIRFIDEHRNRFSVEFICQTLNTHREGGFLSSRGYRQSKARGLSSRAFRDAALVERITKFINKTTVSTGFAKCGACCAARALTLDASKQPG